ncbi:endonuclease YncB(thermonuclease family) [Neorhizobium galegae]|uniref:nuclease n=1 Tax=Neorhizobium galegae TaxID=399 RepID=UPI001AE9367F|nr:nuclease [Neorhizobium galegae]MBP2549199.1 endonuclease YncB(thermonuclease family) [Neorhizobium galegae]
MAKAASSGRRGRRRTSKKTGARLSFWSAALVVVLGGIVVHDNFATVSRFMARNFSGGTGTQPASRQASATRAAPEASPTRTQVKAPVPPRGIGQGPEATTVEEVLARQANLPPEKVAAAKPADDGLVGQGYRNTFYFCGTSGLDNCVASGGVFWFHKQEIRLADVVAPKTENARCDLERQKGFAAKVRLRDLLNQGSFDLVDWPNADGDAHGRKLRVVLRSGQSLGQQLVREGLVQGVAGAPRPWC